MYYYKFPIKIHDIDINQIKGNSIYKKLTFEEFTISNLKYLEDKLNQHLIFQIKPDEYNLTEIKYPGPAVHSDAFNTALNIYIQTDEHDLTAFYEPTESNLSRYYDVTEYSNSQLKLLDETKFKTGDCVLLNTKIPHTVRITNYVSNRLILRLIWKYDNFLDVMESISLVDHKL